MARGPPLRAPAPSASAAPRITWANAEGCHTKPRRALDPARRPAMRRPRPLCPGRWSGSSAIPKTGAPARRCPGRRGGPPDGDDRGDAAPAPGDRDRDREADRAGRNRRLRTARRRRGHALHPPRPPPPRDLPRARQLHARAVPRRPARHLHLDSVRRRRPPLPRRRLRPVRDVDRPPGAGQSSPDRPGQSRLRAPLRRAITGPAGTTPRWFSASRASRWASRDRAAVGSGAWRPVP